MREGRWQVMIHGESYKLIVAEAAKAAIGEENIYQRVFVCHLLKDRRDPNRIAGAIGFSTRDPKIYVFKARAVVCACGGATTSGDRTRWARAWDGSGTRSSTPARSTS